MHSTEDYRKILNRKSKKVTKLINHKIFTIIIFYQFYNTEFLSLYCDKKKYAYLIDLFLVNVFKIKVF